MTLDPIEIGDRLRDRRRRLAMSQSTLADIIGTTQGHVSGWERGRHLVSLETAVTLSEALKISLDHLVLGK
jgi:transcriptional regulator with XRE-family HTH domain